LPQPLVAIPVAVLALLSVYRLIIDWHSVRSHVLLVWLAVLIPLVGLGAAGNLAALFVPVMLLAAIGFQEVIRYWYTIFPRNPYARIFGLLPLGLLVLTIIQFNYQRYFLAMPYSREIVSLYNEDPFLLTNTITAKTYQNQHIMLIVNSDDTALYVIDQAIAKNLVVVRSDQFGASNNATTVIIAETAFAHLTDAQRAALPASTPHVIVTDRAEDALRFRVFNIL
jgi:cellulose synthase/poly-beta-1,6-N-acetylglucosamine synthase-like glycosyltransferase